MTVYLAWDDDDHEADPARAFATLEAAQRWLDSRFPAGPYRDDEWRSEKRDDGHVAAGRYMTASDPLYPYPYVCVRIVSYEVEA